MDVLRAGLEDALSGRGRLLMLVGEPGIGKTRTAQELATYARLRKAQVLWGRCYEGEGAPAYWPWVRAVREYVRDRDSKVLLSELGSGAANIGQMVSEVRERLPGLPEPPTLEPEQARFRLFDSITQFLQNAALTRGIDAILLGWEQGRVDESDQVLQVALDMYPLIASNLLCASSAVLSVEGRELEVRERFEKCAAKDFRDIPKNVTWFASLVYLAEACAFLGDARRAKKLYDLLLPYSSRVVTIGPVLSLGSTACWLGRLAATMGQFERPSQHFEYAIEMNARMGTRQAVVRTQLHYADLLLNKGNPDDRAKALALLNGSLDIGRELGMKVVVEQALSLKFRALGVSTEDFRTSIAAVTIAVERERPDLLPHAAPDGTVTILFSDIENSTLMTEKLGDRRWMALLRDHNRIVRDHLATHGGFEVKSQGDGFMLAFQSAAAALRCAIAMQQAFTAYVQEHPDDAVRVRMGLHTGEAIKEANDFFGKTVILAARIAAQAEGGEVLVSSLVKNVTESTKEFIFGKPRQLLFKGLSGTYEVHTLAL